MTDDSLQQRVIELETLVMHLQHDLEQMHQVLIQRAADFETLHEKLQRLEGRMEGTDELPPLPDALDDRPPHY